MATPSRFALEDGGDEDLVVEDLAPAMGETSCIVCPNGGHSIRFGVASGSGRWTGPQRRTGRVPSGTPRGNDGRQEDGPGGRARPGLDRLFEAWIRAGDGREQGPGGAQGGRGRADPPGVRGADVPDRL